MTAPATIAPDADMGAAILAAADRVATRERMFRGAYEVEAEVAPACFYPETAWMHPCGVVHIRECLQDMQHAAFDGDVAEFGRLAGVIHWRMRTELGFHLENCFTASRTRWEGIMEAYL